MYECLSCQIVFFVWSKIFTFLYTDLHIQALMISFLYSRGFISKSYLLLEILTLIFLIAPNLMLLIFFLMFQLNFRSLINCSSRYSPENPKKVFTWFITYGSILIFLVSHLVLWNLAFQITSLYIFYSKLNIKVIGKLLCLEFLIMWTFEMFKESIFSADFI